MLRCVLFSIRRALMPMMLVIGALTALSLLMPAAHAQITTALRPFPPQSFTGELRVAAWPLVELNGEPAQLAPGSRIRGGDNMLILPASLTGQMLRVNYTLDFQGQIMDVWVLRDAEARRPWPRSAEQAAKWKYDPLTQSWERPWSLLPRTKTPAEIRAEDAENAPQE